MNIIKIDNKHYIKSKIVMLPTKNKTLVWKGNGILSIRKYLDTPLHQGILNQHLYLLSDEEIKEGDWFYGEHWFGNTKPQKYTKDNFISENKSAFRLTIKFIIISVSNINSYLFPLYFTFKIL